MSTAEGNMPEIDYTKNELIADIGFLAKRASKCGGFEDTEKRSWGIAANSLIDFAYSLCSMQTLKMPADKNDFNACQRAFKKLPEHRKTRDVLCALEKQRTAFTNE
jgi:hypothetical protein